MTKPQDDNLAGDPLPSGEDWANEFASEAATREESDSLEKLDALLRLGFHEVDQATAKPSEEHVNGILSQLRPNSGVSTSRRTRRSVRVLLWITLVFLTLLGSYALITLALEATRR